MSDESGKSKPTIVVGISGWTFEGWRGSFYPDGLKQKDELVFASRKVTAIEVNGTFHSLFRSGNFQSWAAQTPAEFVLSLKAPRYVTHERRLRDVETPIANFFASGLLALGKKLGPILWQLPPTLHFDRELVATFFGHLPHDMRAASLVARGHSDWMSERACFDFDDNLTIRHALEVRHESYVTPELIDLARRHKVAIVVGDTAGRWPLIDEPTADFTYLRLHADETVYPNGYDQPAIERWAERARLCLDGGRDVYIYFDNDVKELAPLNALSMLSHLEQRGLVPLKALEILPAAPATGVRKTVARAASPKKASPPKRKRAGR